MNAGPTLEAAAVPSRRYVRFVLSMMMLTMVLSSVDRTVLSILVQDIKKDLLLDDRQMGWLLGPAFTVFHMLASFPLAAIADRGHRRIVIAIGLFFWSLFTTLTSQVTGFWSLFFLRMGVGIGEASASAPGQSLIASYVPPEDRSRSLSVIAIGSVFGLALGMIVGGYVIEWAGWRLAFVVAGVPGIVFSVVFFATIREPSVGSQRGVSWWDTPGTGPLGPTCQNAYYGWCGKRCLKLLSASLAEGGLGFSSTRSAAHNDADGQPVPSRHAELEELYRLCRTTGEFPGTSLEMLPGTSTFSEEDKEILTQMSLAADRPVNWNLIAPRADMPEVTENQLGASDYAAERGAVALALTVPQELSGRLNLLSGFAFDALPRWAEVIGLPVEERKKALADPAVRETLRRGGEERGPGPLKGLTRWGEIGIEETFEPENQRWQGRTVGELAAERGIDPLDGLLDLSLSEGLRTSFASPTEGQTDPESWQMRADSWTDPRTIVGASDAGAHLDMMDTFAFTTQLLGRRVREMSLISLEEGVRQLTDVPARLYGLRERGRLEPGFHADVVVFDPDRVAKGPTQTRFDLPAGAPRLYAEAEGIDHVFVNGLEIVRDGIDTGARPGAILRSGRDTRTVEKQTWMSTLER